MFALTDILAYAVFVGSQFAALCAMTRGGRGWPWRVVGLVVLVILAVAGEWCWHLKLFPLDQWLAICFAANIAGMTALIFVLSRDSLGRRSFLAVTFGAYAACFAAMFHMVAYRNVFGLPGLWPGAIGGSVVLVMIFVFIVRVLPWLSSTTGK